MAIDFRASNTKAELLEIAAANNVAADDSMTKTQIIAALEAHNAARQPEASGVTDNAVAGENSARGGEESAQTTQEYDGTNQAAQSGIEQPEISGETDNTPIGENATQIDVAEKNEEYSMFAYVGPALPHGRLKENAVFRGKIEDVLSYLQDVLEDYPQVEKLIVPTHKLAIYAVKAKTPGNVVNKHYTDIVSTMHGNKEV